MNRSNQLSSGPLIGRFAPSPTGRMHAGNIFAYLIAWIVAKRQSGRIVLRIEDLDQTRSRAAFAELLLKDFEAFGLSWDEGPIYQSERIELYEAAFQHIRQQAVVYPCYCTRADLHAAAAPHEGQAAIYAGTCRGLTPEQRLQAEVNGKRPAWRLALPDQLFTINDTFQGLQRINIAKNFGDCIIKRSDGSFAYQLAVVVDDAQLGVNSVIRGFDLLPSAAVQSYMFALLGKPVPSFGHVPLLMAPSGHRIAKRDHSASLEQLLIHYKSPQRVLGRIAYLGGIVEEDGSYTSDELLSCAQLDSLRGVTHITIPTEFGC